MALLWFDGFDTQDGVSGIYFSANVFPVAGRYGGKGITLNNGANTGFARIPIVMSGSSIFIGFALYVQSGATGIQTLLTLPDGTTLAVDMSDGSFTIDGTGGVYSATSPGNAAYLNTWNFIEVGIKFAVDTSGSFEVRINGAAIPSLTASGVQTSNHSNVNSVELNGNGYGSTYFDDYYICDGSGSVSNTFLGNQKVNLYMPSGAGAATHFVPEGEPANWKCVSEIPPDGDSTYVASSNPGDVDAYALALIPGQSPSTGTITAIKVTADARIDDAGSRTLAIGVGNGTNEEYAAPVGLGGTYVSYPALFPENPFTSNPWNNSDLSSLQAAIKA